MSAEDDPTAEPDAVAALLMDVALARGSGTADDYVAALMRGVASYPVLSLTSPVAAWLDELEQLGEANDIHDTTAWALFWRAFYAMASGDLDEAGRALERIDGAALVQDANRQLASVGAYRLALARGESPAKPAWWERGEPPASQVVAVFCRLADAEAMALREPQSAESAFLAVREVLPHTQFGLRALVARELGKRCAGPERAKAFSDEAAALLAPAAAAGSAEAVPTQQSGEELGFAQKFGCGALVFAALAVVAMMIYARCG